MPGRPYRTQREALTFLGDEYKLKIIDGENCIYRDLGNGRDIEVSGMRSVKSKMRICNYICVWENVTCSLEYIRADDGSGRLKTLHDLKRELDALVEKYGGTP